MDTNTLTQNINSDETCPYCYDDCIACLIGECGHPYEWECELELFAERHIDKYENVMEELKKHYNDCSGEAFLNYFFHSHLYHTGQYPYTKKRLQEIHGE